MRMSRGRTEAKRASRLGGAFAIGLLGVCLCSAATGCGGDESSSSTTQASSNMVPVATEGWPSLPSKMNLDDLDGVAIPGAPGCSFEDIIGISCENHEEYGVYEDNAPPARPSCHEKADGEFHCLASNGVAVEVWSGDEAHALRLLRGAIEAIAATASGEAVPAPESEDQGSPAYVGSITASGEGTTVKDEFELGPLVYGVDSSPPEEVLSSCLIGGRATVASSVFAEGRLTVTYVHGTLPLAFTPYTELIKAEGQQATLASLQIDGGWHCAIEDLINMAIEFEPGESQTFAFWMVDPGAISNAHPKLSEEDLDQLYFGFLGQPIGNITDLSISGPGKGWCEDEFDSERRLLLFNRSGSC